MVEGITELERRWFRVPVQVRARVKQAMAKTADEIVEQLYTAAPHITGDLAGSIGWTWGDPPVGSVVLMRSPNPNARRVYGVAEPAADIITIYAGNRNVFYARFVEFGTRRSQAQPFFYPTWRRMKRRARDRMNRAIREAMASI